MPPSHYQIKTLVVHTREITAESLQDAYRQIQPELRRDAEGHPNTVKVLSIEPVTHSEAA